MYMYMLSTRPVTDDELKKAYLTCLVVKKVIVIESKSYVI
jgi:hypothetical protein